MTTTPEQAAPAAVPPPDLAAVLGFLPFNRQAPIWSQVYSVLRDRVADLRLPPLYPLSEKDIAAVLGVSRTPVREALIRLSEEGLVDIYPQYGTFVAPIRVGHLSNAQFIRESLECSIVRQVAETADPLLIARIEHNIDEQAAAAEAGDDAAFFALDEQMHQAFSLACGREAVWRFIQGAKVHIDRVRHLILPQDLKVRRLVDEHRAVLAGIAAGSPDQAAQAMREHLNGLFRSLPEIEAAQPSYFETRHSNQRPLRAERAR